MMLSTCQRLIIFKVLRTSGMIKDDKGNQKFNFRMLKKFVPISFIILYHARCTQNFKYY